VTPRSQLLPHQRAAVSDLERFAREGHRAGLVVAPTGAGKSRILSTWLTQRVVEHGERVLWVAHRRSLVLQAAGELTRAFGHPVPHVTAAALANTSARMVVASVASLRTRPAALRRWARRGPAWLVLDEAHHAPARSFRSLIEAAKTANVRVVGATATPTRTTTAERPVLAALFDGHVITRVALQPLVEQSVLARATLVRLATGAVADDATTPTELRRLARTGDLAPSWLRRLAELAPRNRVVLQHLGENRARYGPTIVFANDVIHAALLTRSLRARGFRADYATGERPDGTSGAIPDVIARFNAAELDVIVGVDALDEGVDLVRARTVVLMRPTRSETRLRQSIGRVLRGPALGGDANAFVVVAEDQWHRVAGFHSTLDLVQELFVPPLGAAPAVTRSGRGRDADTPAFSHVAGADEWLTTALSTPSIDVTESGPVARMVTRVAGRVGVIPISALQLPGWRGLLAELSAMGTRELRAAEPETILARFFSPLDDVPEPPLSDVVTTIAHTREHEVPPQIEHVDAVESPLALALRIRERDLGEIARSDLLRRAYAGSARHLYASVDELRMSVDAVLTRLMS
jgi:superfamily II DNA or RNA helicase